jgi:hypothetical protein
MPRIPVARRSNGGLPVPWMEAACYIPHLHVIFIAPNFRIEEPPPPVDLPQLFFNFIIRDRN